MLTMRKKKSKSRHFLLCITILTHVLVRKKKSPPSLRALLRSPSLRGRSRKRRPKLLNSKYTSVC